MREITQSWLAIAKVEFLLSTAKIRKRRRTALSGIVMLAMIWASVLVFSLVDIVLASYQPSIWSLFMSGLPAMNRALCLALWLLFFAIPMSKAVQEIKFSQWEILLSTGVSTRDILFGQWLGRTPIYLLFISFITPPIIAPVILIFQVQWQGVIAIYGCFVLIALPALWVSDILASVIQTRLSQSPRGDAIARVISFLMTMTLVLPMFAILFFSESWTQLIANRNAIFLPFIWGGDLVSWIVLRFAGIELSPTLLETYNSVLVIDALGCTILILSFVFLVLGIGALTADRVFTFDIGARAERVKTMTRDNQLLRGIRRLLGWPTGALVVFALKDFFRKTWNTARYFAALVLGFMPLVVLSVAVSSLGEMNNEALAFLP
ncbi:MAG: hypothetical protein ACTSQE_17370, partial [Candidatus Heimdallarchaeaceae archaeon]